MITTLRPSSLQSIHGFRDLGTRRVPVDPATDVVDRHKYLSSLVAADDSGREDPSVLNDDDRISRLVRRLKGIHGIQSEGIPIQMSTIPVLSDSQEALWTDGQGPVWKWIKPESSYDVTSGFWETDLERAITDGEWRAGRDLQLLVRGVTEQMREELVSRKVTHLGNA
ncbi:hypothetical protein ACLMJK_005637 [Lecanora helva]